MASDRIVGYETLPAALLLRRGGEMERLVVEPGEYLDLSLGDRGCAGSVVDDRHRPCPAGSDATPWCPDCDETWVCARCTGTCLKETMDCHQDHAIYLAAFAPDAFKVGVTKHERLDTRLREQGADRAAHLRTVANGRIAREIEADLATDVGDRVRVERKRRGLHRSDDADAWNDLLDDVDPVETFAFDYGLDLVDRPLAATTARGRVRGTKGRLLVLDRSGSTYAVDLRDLVGHELTADPNVESLQSNLRAF